MRQRFREEHFQGEPKNEGKRDNINSHVWDGPDGPNPKYRWSPSVIPGIAKRE